MKLSILDETNFHLDVPESILKKIIEKFKIPNPKAFATAGFKLGTWDGKESLISDEGFGYIFMLDDILAHMEDMGLDLNVMEIEDHRDASIPTPRMVDNQYLLQESGFTLREHQVDAINSVIVNKKGYVNAATSAGKTWICVGISKAFDPYLKSVIIVPSTNLARQTYEDYAKSNLSTLLLEAKIKPEKREEAIKAHRHVIVTEKLFANCIEYFEGSDWLFIKDEVQILGQMLIDVLRVDCGTWPVRIGLTGTFPKDRLKATETQCVLGGGELVKVSGDYLQQNNFAATVDIEVVTTSHQEIEEVFRELEADKTFDWSLEQNYNNTNDLRAKAIADHIEGLDKIPTLILCHPQTGKMVAEFLGCENIDQETPVDTRQKWLRDFETDPEFRICASYQTSGTGLSIDQIRRLVLIDVGKNYTNIMQGIGRGMRLDDGKDSVHVLDISSNNKYGERHRKERLALYRKENYKYNDTGYEILIKEQ